MPVIHKFYLKKMKVASCRQIMIQYDLCGLIFLSTKLWIYVICFILFVMYCIHCIVRAIVHWHEIKQFTYLLDPYWQ